MKPVKSTPSTSLRLPAQVCFRVTRYCNARCVFCLAPPDGSHPDQDTLVARIDWLLERGVRTVHFCGGEPSLHPALPALVRHVRARRARTRVTTNAIAIQDELLAALRAAGAEVKVSLHGDRERHDELVGREAFEPTTRNLRRIAAAGIPVSIQTTLVAGGAWVIDWVAAFCLERGIRRASFLPFLPRGSGYERRSEYELSPRERRAHRDHLAKKRRELSGRLDLRWLDFSSRPLHVVESDGRLVLEGATEAFDHVLCRIPVPAEASRPPH